MYTASCLCGGVKIQINQCISEIFVCHCRQCQKGQGSAFVAVATIEKNNMIFLQGEALLGEYFATPNKKRVFCKRCASPIFSARMDLPEIIRLRVGIVDQALDQAKVYSHAFTDFKACWFDLPNDTSLKFENVVL